MKVFLFEDRSATVSKVQRDQGQYVLSRGVVFSFRMNDRHFGEEDIGLPRDFVRCDDESDMSPKESPRVVEACVDVIVGAAVAVGIVVSITARAGLTVMIQVAVRVDERHLLIVPIHLVRRVLVRWIVTRILWVAGGRGAVHGVLSVAFVLKLDSGVEHGDRSATKIRSHQYARGNVISLLFVSIHVIIVDPVVEEDVVHIVDTADTPLLREFA